MTGTRGCLTFITFLILYFGPPGGVLCWTRGRGLNLRHVSIPRAKLRGETAVLECHYELGRGELYSVKWYKDNEEFYRYMPKSVPPASSFRVEGVRIDYNLSNDKQVALRNVNLKSTGIYRCEVSAEAPKFVTVQHEGRMEVVFLPRDGPHITGEQKQYQIGDLMNLNCTSGKSYPVSELHWYINDQPVRTENNKTSNVDETEVLIRYPAVTHPHGLMSSALGLHFTVAARHFIDGDMRVRCLARVSPVLWQGESVMQRGEPANVREALLLVKGSANRATPCTVILLLAAAAAVT